MQLTIFWKKSSGKNVLHAPKYTFINILLGAESSGKFQYHKFKHKVWKKYNLRWSRLCFKISQSVPEWISNQITLLFAVQFLRRKSGVYILKVPQRDDEWNSKRGK